jgi:REP element-mobilizing transposase RayT
MDDAGDDEAWPFPCGVACVVTVHTLYRRPVFRDPQAAHAIAHMQSRSLPRHRAAWLAWVLMPDHWQGLLVCGADESLAALAGRFKAMSCRAVAARHRVNGWLWERGFREQRLGAEESLVDAARVLVTAPRRAGLVERVDQYPYWGAAWVPDAGASARADAAGCVRGMPARSA